MTQSDFEFIAKEALQTFSSIETIATSKLLSMGVAVAELFFSSLKKERVKRKVCSTKEEAKSEIFEYIEVFYNRKRHHSQLNQLIPMMFEKLRNGN